MGLKGYLYRKIIQPKQEQKKLEKAIEEDVKKKNYGKYYAEAYKEKLRRETKAKFAPQKSSGSGIKGKLKKSGFLKPDYAFINNALYGSPMGLGSPVKKKYPVKKHKRVKRKGKKIIIYT